MNQPSTHQIRHLLESLKVENTDSLKVFYKYLGSRERSSEETDVYNLKSKLKKMTKKDVPIQDLYKIFTALEEAGIGELKKGVRVKFNWTYFIIPKLNKKNEVIEFFIKHRSAFTDDPHAFKAFKDERKYHVEASSDVSMTEIMKYLDSEELTYEIERINSLSMICGDEHGIKVLTVVDHGLMLQITPEKLELKASYNDFEENKIVEHTFFNQTYRGLKELFPDLKNVTRKYFLKTSKDMSLLGSPATAVTKTGLVDLVSRYIMGKKLFSKKAIRVDKNLGAFLGINDKEISSVELYEHLRKVLTQR